MWSNLICNGIVYSDFLINKNGEVKNTKTNHVTKIMYIVVDMLF